MWESRARAGPIATLWLAALVCLGPVAGARGAPSRYGQDPLSFHRRLREDYLAGRATRQRVEGAHQEGDDSFEGLDSWSSATARGLHLQLQALHAWSRGQRSRARRLYHRAYGLLRQRAPGEAAFCLYYIAETFAEEERYSENLKWLERAREEVRGHPRPYLQGLLEQSRGYSFWFLDYLGASTRAFARARRFWEQIGFAEGQISCWNNSASLYEELRLWPRAEETYRRAIERMEEARVHPETRFWLLRNYALFLHRRGRQSEARLYLARALQFSRLAPQEALLDSARVEGQSRRVLSLLKRIRQPSLRIEAERVAGHLLLEEGKTKEALRHLHRAHGTSLKLGLGYQLRLSSAALGEALERAGDFEGALEVYRESSRRDPVLYARERVYPYSRAASPLLDGWIRCLIRLGRPGRARRLVHWLDALRARKAALLLSALPNQRGSAHAEAVASFEPENVPPALPPEGGVTLLELWPDGRRLYAWIERSGQTWFQEVDAHLELKAAVAETVLPLYSASAALPPPPPPRLLNRLYRSLLAPLEEHLGRRLLIIPHKELEHLPLEMLVDDRGKPLVDSYTFSYLPRAPSAPARLPPRQPPALLLSPTSTLGEVPHETAFFTSYFPDLRIAHQLLPGVLGPSRWIHLSSHYALDRKSWTRSRLGTAPGLEALSLISRPLACGLISLGMCDGGNSYSSDSPFWLGLGELLLLDGAQGVLLSRWPMEEQVSRIFREFYRLARQGLTCDVALSRARRLLAGTVLQRAGRRAPGDHPFFWAGITYVGRPNFRLYPRPPACDWVWLLSPALWLALSVGSWMEHRHRPGGRASATPGKRERSG